MNIIIKTEGTRNNPSVRVKIDKQTLEHQGRDVFSDFGGKYFGPYNGRVTLWEGRIQREVEREIKNSDLQEVIKKIKKEIKDEKNQIISSLDFTPTVGVFEFEI